MTGRSPYRWRRPPFLENRVARWMLPIGIVAYLAWALSSIPFNLQRIVDGIPRAAQIFGGSVPPDFSRWSLLYSGTMESIQISIVATAVGVLLSIPAAIMSARNVAPLPVFLVGRALVITARSFHPVIVAIIFVKAVGFGAFAGILTLIVYTVGFVGKLLAEAIEEVDWGQVEAMRATGAGYFKTLAYAVMPQILPRQVGLTLYQLDINLRASTVVGIVGAGGIGSTLMNAFGRYDYAFALAILLVIIAVVFVTEVVSGRIRRSVA
ncbi:MAG: phosphonate ABC transporter, permease protein PhnE [Trueperaceae bacterium]